MADIVTAASFTGRDLTILVPTYKRPDKLTKLLESVAAQSEPVRRVIVVDGFTDAEKVARDFAGRLTVEYLRCDPPGQIRQRNLGLRALDAGDRLVALLDDDIVLLPDAVSAMIAFWNTVGETAAAVAFNIINGEAPGFSPIGAALGLTAREPGLVLRSGMTTGLSHLAQNARVQWVPGGATVWRADILRQFEHREIQTRWAIAEDLIFSYRVGKQHALYVCAAAQVRHEHVSDYGVKRQERYHGRTQTLWMYYFVATNPDLSRALFFWTLLVRMAGKLGRSIARRDRGELDFAVGQLGAAGAILARTATGRDLQSLLQDRA